MSLSATEVADAGSQGTRLGDSRVRTIVANALTSTLCAVRFVLSSAIVSPPGRWPAIP